MRGNGDLKVLLTPQSPENETRHPKEAVKGADIAHMGYQTLDQVSTGPYSDKERPGLSDRFAYPKRFSDV